jgi:CRP-like cAMP-binding protein
VNELVLVIEGEATFGPPGNARSALGPGDFVGELALLGEIAHGFTVTSRTPMQILVADRRGLVTAMEHPGVLRQIAKSLVRQLQSPSEAMTSGCTEVQTRHRRHRLTGGGLSRTVRGSQDRELAGLSDELAVFPPDLEVLVVVAADHVASRGPAGEPAR